MGIDEELAHGSLRLTLGAEHTEADVDRTIGVAASAIERLRAAREMVATA
jgi:cysteine sulfinate desulfinase/cysteine desulfurase-like protein